MSKYNMTDGWEALQPYRRRSYITHTTTPVIYHWISGSYHTLKYLYTSNHIRYYTLKQPTKWTPESTATPITIYPTATHNNKRTFILNSPLVLSPHQPSHPSITPYFEFDDYVRLLPAWESSILQNIIFETGPFIAIQSICNAPHPTKTFYEVSDGSMQYDTTSFGWVFGTTESKIAWASGPGFGTATSHRAEGWGKLSAALFLKHLQIFTGQTFPTNMRIASFSDNKRLSHPLNLADLTNPSTPTPLYNQIGT